MNQTNRILVNTIAQYVKIILGIVLLLYSTRIVLEELGNNDFGLYSLIGSILAFLNFLNVTTTRATQRFLSFYMGKKDVELQKKVLFNSILLHLAISLLTFLIVLSLQPFLFDGFLNITTEKIDIAKVLYILMAITVVFTINIAPLNAIFISHENIVFTSLVYVMVAGLRLLAAFVLGLVEGNKIMWYGVMMCVISICELLIYLVVAWRKYPECKTFFTIKNYDGSLLKSILSFSGWNLYGTVCILGRTQGYAFVINKFMGLIANASYGIATQVSGQINNLVYSISNAISPVIMREEGAENRNRMIFFSIESSKISFLLFAFIAIPIISEIHIILNWWLGDIPQYTIPFVVSMIIASLADSFASGLRTGIQAIGKLKKFSLYVSTIKLLTIPVAIVMLIHRINLMYVFIPYIISDIIGTAITIKLFCRYTNYPVKQMIKLLLTLLSCLLLSIVVCRIINMLIQPGIQCIIFAGFFSSLVSSLWCYYYALGEVEKKYINAILNKLCNILHFH